MAAVWANGLLVTLKVWCFIFFFKLSLFTLYIRLPHSKGFAKCNGGCVRAEWFLSINSSYTLQSGTKYSRNEPISDFHTHTLDVQCFSDVYQMVPFNNRVIVPQ